MERTGELRIQVHPEGEHDPDARELAEFITLFRGAYVAGLRIERTASSELTPRGMASLILRDLAKRDAAATTDLFGERRRDALRTRRISHDSPLEIVFCGVIVVLAAAGILAGGRFRLGPLEVDLPRGLGESITALRSAFAPRTRAGLGFGVLPKTIKLTKAEFDELMSYDPATRSRGGFQRKLIELQARTDRKNRTLTLYPSDIDWILKHGSQPKKGGWQASIRRIFGSHFWQTSE